MMKLLFNDQEYKAERIVKTDDSIICYDGNSPVFTFRGISDFSDFLFFDGDLDITLQVFKESKLSELNQAYTKELTSGFTSNGVRFKYAEIDQLNFSKRTNAIALGTSDETFHFGTADGVKQFTIDDFKIAAKDAEIHEMNVYGKLESLRQQVNQASTREEIEAVEW